MKLQLSMHALTWYSAENAHCGLTQPRSAELCALGAHELLKVTHMLLCALTQRVLVYCMSVV